MHKVCHLCKCIGLVRKEKEKNHEPNKKELKLWSVNLSYPKNIKIKIPGEPGPISELPREIFPKEPKQIRQNKWDFKNKKNNDKLIN